MYYTIYVTINKINGHFYIGKHKTENLNDRYLGSGNVLKQAIKKYKRKSFIKLISEKCDSEFAMDQREKAIVTTQFIKENDDICYNICPGGYGGSGTFGPHNLPKTNPLYIKWAEKNSKSSVIRISTLPKDDPRFIEWNEKRQATLPQNLPHDDQRFIKWKDVHYSVNPANKTKDSDLYKSWLEKQKNGSLKKRGKIWINNPIQKQIKLISKKDSFSFVSNGWILGRPKHFN